MTEPSHVEIEHERTRPKPDPQLVRHLNRQLLRYAVQTAIYNEDGSIADIRRSVLITLNTGEKTVTSLIKGEVYDRTTRAQLEDALYHTPTWSAEVLDGRELFGGRRSRPLDPKPLTVAPPVEDQPAARRLAQQTRGIARGQGQLV